MVVEGSWRVEVYPSRAEWLEARRATYGSSDVPAILGLGRSSYYEAWAIRTGRVAEDSLEGNRAVELGTILEPVAARYYESDTGRELWDPGDWTIFRRDGLPLVHATPDRVVVPGTVVPEPMPLEIKCPTSRQASRWRDRPPDAVLAQLATQMLVLGSRRGSACCLVDADLVWYDVDADPEFEELLLAAVERFDWYVRTDREPPARDHLEATRRALEAVYPRGERSEWVALGDEADELAEAWLRADAAARGPLRDVARIKNRIRQMVGDGRGGETPQGRRFSAARGLRWTNKSAEE